MSTGMPFKQVGQLRKQVDAGDRDRDFSQRFTTALFTVTRTLDTLDKMSNPELTDPRITTDIGNLTQMIESNDSAYNKDLYRSITSILTSLHTIKKDKRDLINSGMSKAQQNSSNITSCESDKILLTSKIKQIQGLVDVFEGKLDPSFVAAVRKLQP